MIKAFFKHAKNRWFAFLLCLPGAFAGFTVAVFAIVMPLAYIDVPDSIAWAVSVIPFSIITSLPLLIITIPAARTVSLEKGNSVKKNLLIYHCSISLIILAVVLLIVLIYDLNLYAKYGYHMF